MKKIIFTIVVACLMAAISCNTGNNSGTNIPDELKAQKNLAAFDAINDAFKTGDVSKIDSVVADDFVDHTERGDIYGKDSLKAMITMMHDNLKDWKTEVLHKIADKDYVYGWMRYMGNSDGSMGMPPGPFDMSSIEVVKYNSDGKATGHWAFMEMKDVMKMMKQ